MDSESRGLADTGIQGLDDVLAGQDARHQDQCDHQGLGGPATGQEPGTCGVARNVVGDAAPLALTSDQFAALVLGLPWQRLGEFSVISRS